MHLQNCAGVVLTLCLAWHQCKAKPPDLTASVVDMMFKASEVLRTDGGLILLWGPQHNLYMNESMCWRSTTEEHNKGIYYRLDSKSRRIIANNIVWTWRSFLLVYALHIGNGEVLLTVKPKDDADTPVIPSQLLGTFSILYAEKTCIVLKLQKLSEAHYPCTIWVPEIMAKEYNKMCLAVTKKHCEHKGIDLFQAFKKFCY